MALQKYIRSTNRPHIVIKPLSFSGKMHEKSDNADPEMRPYVEVNVDIDMQEVYFLIMHFLSGGPCQRTSGQLWNELLDHNLLPRRYHAWYSRNGARSGEENDDGLSFPISYSKLVERYPHVEKDYLIKLLKELIRTKAQPLPGMIGGNYPNAADVPTLMGTGCFSLFNNNQRKPNAEVKRPPVYMRWPHMHADQVRGLRLREIGGGFGRHHRPPSIRAACYAIAKPSTMVQKMVNIKKLRGHRSAVYCAIFDNSGRFVITGSDDRLVKIWSMETTYCLASCRGHEGDITDLAVSSNDALVASSSNDFVIRVWRLPDGLPISVLRGHAGAVTAIAFSPRPSAVYQLLSSSDDGTCRLWDARYSQFKPRIYVPKPPDPSNGKCSVASSSAVQRGHQIFCCAFNASGTVFVTGSSDTLARVWNACKTSMDDSEQPNHEMDVLSGHENDVNYVQFSGCGMASRSSHTDISKDDNVPKFKNSWFAHDNIVTCSRDGSAIIWIPRSRKSHGKAGRWSRAYHLKVPPAPTPPQPQRGGPRQRVPLPPRGVNMIVWSLDNRFVLAAIMDRRICVWNASDGSLVHCLTGHTDSTYVLDVHPFNSRIAMSAGYDGRTIVWDIWEGKPIRIYETGPFKLVDGKFSPDGTSIILSDDVGQLYVLSTGQGEWQEDAKYDQFFLGDYRPLIQDTHGNVVDQETQLVPYRRNMQDLLCDSGLIPYPEPYQSMYQRRRLGMLGIEWRPPSVRLAVGLDFTSDQEYQIPPLADLDELIDPLPQFADTMEWEPEIQVQSDDSDSEFDITEISPGDFAEELSSTTTGDSEDDGEDIESDDDKKDAVRRPKRKNHKREIEIMTSSGRRVKRRNMDEYDDDSHRIRESHKSRSKAKASKKSSSSKSSRPQRVAARNALNFFSRITGASLDVEDEDGLEDEFSGSESSLQNSSFESEESDRFVLGEQMKLAKGKGIVSDESDDGDMQLDFHESYKNAGTRKRLVLKFSSRDKNKLFIADNSAVKPENGLDLEASSSRVATSSRAIRTHGNNSRLPPDPNLSSDQNRNGHERTAFGQSRTGKSTWDLSDDPIIKWGGVRARSSKRARLGEALASSVLPVHDAANNCQNESSRVHLILEAESGSTVVKGEDQVDEAVNRSHTVVGSLESLNGARNEKPHSPYSLNDGHNEDKVAANGVDSFFSNSIPNMADSSTLFKICSGIQMDQGDGECGASGNDLSDLNDKGTHEKPEVGSDDHEEGRNSFEQKNGEKLCSLENGSGNPVSGDATDLSSQKNDRMFRAVYRRSKALRPRAMPLNDNVVSNGSTPHHGNHGIEDHDEGTIAICATSNGVVNRSRRLSGHTPDSDSPGSKSLGSSEKTENASLNDQPSSQEWGLRTVGIRSSRNRRVNFVRDTSPVDRRKTNHSQKKLSWLMLSVHEGSRYIPQQGDEVVYLRQGHQEYINYIQLSERRPWEYLKCDIRAVEFCKVIDLDYSTLPGSGDSCCKMRLEFTDPSSNAFGKTFKLTLPEVTSFPDFLVERTRYEAAIQRNWTARDKCQVWWKNEGEEDGSWWDGRILSVKAKSAEFPDSPWERYLIRYKSDPGEAHSHSPWELYDDSTQWEQPHIDDPTRKKLLSAITKLQQMGNRGKDIYGVQKLKQVSQKSNFQNRFPVPLSIDVIQARLENNYYRSAEALKHDAKVVLSNAEAYLGKNVEFSVKLKRLSDWFTRTLSL